MLFRAILFTLCLLLGSSTLAGAVPIAVASNSNGIIRNTAFSFEVAGTSGAVGAVGTVALTERISAQIVGNNGFCNDTEILFQLELMIDDWPTETSWELLNITADEDVDTNVVHEEESYGIRRKIYNEEYCIPRNACYKFILYDSAGDGLCCNYGNGYYKVEIQDNKGSILKTFEEREFRSFESVVVFNFGDNGTACQTESLAPSPSPSTSSPTATGTQDKVAAALLPVMFSFAVIGSLILLIVCFRECHTRDEALREQAHNNNINDGNNNNNNSQGTNLTEQQQQENRRLKVLTSIIHKKVLSRRKVTGVDHHEENKGQELVLPHEKALSNRRIIFEGGSISRPTEEEGTVTNNVVHQQTLNDFYLSSIVPIAFSPPANDDDGKSRDKLNDDSLVKENIYMESPQQGQSQRSLVSTSSLYSPRSCSICLEEYKVGDEIAWSENNQCPHAFHLDCMVNWLMKHDECPLCRADYL